MLLFGCSWRTQTCRGRHRTPVEIVELVHMGCRGALSLTMKAMASELLAQKRHLGGGPQKGSWFVRLQ